MSLIVFQEYVDNGVPLPACLTMFDRWLKGLEEEKNFVMMEPGQEYAEEARLCAVATWTGEAIRLPLIYCTYTVSQCYLI